MEYELVGYNGLENFGHPDFVVEYGVWIRCLLPLHTIYVVELEQITSKSSARMPVMID
jgi:hypothetical protein